ncbi:Crp/Fnr family transcriptional regulator [Azospirillum humicireducens]|nr:Crp/Fnr family transcriptional regulator [Azospirillum humicireducens]
MLDAAAVMERRDEGEPIYREGDCGDEDKSEREDWLYIIIRGVVALGIAAPDGERRDAEKRLDFDWAGPGEVFGELEVIGNVPLQPRQSDAVALTDTVFVKIKGRAVRAILASDDTGLVSALLTLVAKRQGRMLAALKKTAFVGLVEIRLAASLMEQAKRYGTPQGTALIHPSRKLTQERLGAMVGADRRSVMAALQLWTGLGIVHLQHRGRLTIADSRRLAAIAALQSGQRQSWEPEPLLCEIDAELASGRNVVAHQLAQAALERVGSRHRLAFQHRVVLATARSGAFAEALKRLRSHGLDHRHPDMDIAALEPRILKDRCLATTDPEQRQRFALESARLYEAIAKGGGNHYPAINAATMFLLGGDRSAAERWARWVLETTPPACHLFFDRASRAEAHLILGQLKQAADGYARAVTAPDATPGPVSTCRRQIRMIGEVLGIDIAPVLDKAVQGSVLHFSGHPVFPDPPGEVATVAQEIGQHLELLNVRWAFGSLAGSSEILFAEAMLDRQVELTVVLPCEVQEFIKRSIEPGGASWITRFHHCLDGAQRIIVLPWRRLPPELANSWTDRVAMGLALHRAREMVAPVHQLAAVSQGSVERGRTALVMSQWQALGQDSRIVSCPWQQPVPDHTPLAPVPIPALLLLETVQPSGGLPSEAGPDADGSATLLGIVTGLASAATAQGGRIWLFANVTDAFEAMVALRRVLVPAFESGNGSYRLLLDLASDALDRPHDEIIGNSELVRSRPMTPAGSVAATEAFMIESALVGGRRWQSFHIGCVPVRGEGRPVPMYRLGGEGEDDPQR